MFDYFHRAFPTQLATLEIERPNPAAIAANPDLRDLLFFGGPGWERAAGDLARIPPGDRARFVLSLLLVVVTDQAVHCHFPTAYPAWQRMTRFPKFGWAGFGPHHQDPFEILAVPERAGLVDVAEAVGLAPAFADLWFNEVGTWFPRHLPAVTPGELFAAIVADPQWRHADGEIARAVRAAVEQRVAGARVRCAGRTIE